MAGRSHRALARTIIASQMAPPFMFSGVAVALPALGAELGAGATSLGLVETLFLAGSVSFLLPVGWLADAGDKNTLFKTGLVGFGVCSLLIGSLSYLPALLVIRFLQGVCAAAFAATGPAILADIVPPEQRGRAYGGSLAATYSGLTLGPIVAGLLVDTFGWRSVFFMGGGALLAAFVLVQTMLRSRWRRPEHAPNPVSVLVVLAAVLCGIAGSATIERLGLGASLIAASFGLAAAFVLLQKKLRRPLLDVDALFRNAVLRNALLVQFLLYMTAFSSTFMLSLYLQVSLDRTAQMAGRILAISTVLMAVTAPFAGRLADRFRPSVLSTAGVASVLACTVVGSQLGSGSSVAVVAAVLAAQGLGFGLFSSPNMTTIMGSVPASGRSMASALASKSRHVGMVSGMLLATTLVTLFIGHAPVDEHPAEVAALVGRAYAILAGLNVVALVLSSWSARRAPRPALA
jgi:MFS family permease